MATKATSLQNLLEGLGIARQSLYDTYGTKRDLFISAVKQYINGKTAAVICNIIFGASWVSKKAISEIFYEGINVLKDDARRKECFIMDSAIAQIPHDWKYQSFLTMI